MKQPWTRDEALEALEMGALEIACEPLFAEYAAADARFHRVVRAYESGDRERIADAVRDMWAASGQALGAEWFHNSRAGQRITNALQVLVGVRSRLELYRIRHALLGVEDSA